MEVVLTIFGLIVFYYLFVFVYGSQWTEKFDRLIREIDEDIDWYCNLSVDELNRVNPGWTDPIIQEWIFLYYDYKMHGLTILEQPKYQKHAIHLNIIYKELSKFNRVLKEAKRKI